MSHPVAEPTRRALLDEGRAVLDGRAEIRRRAATWAGSNGCHCARRCRVGCSRVPAGTDPVGPFLSMRRLWRERSRRSAALTAVGVDPAAARFLGREPLGIDPSAFAVVQGVIDAEAAAGRLRSELSRWPSGWHPTGHYGIDAEDVRRAWFAAGCRDGGKFRAAIRLLLWSCARGTSLDRPPAPRKRDRYGDLRRIERGYRAWMAIARFSRTGLHAWAPPITRRALWTLGAISPVARGAAVRRLYRWANASGRRIGREDVWAAIRYPHSVEAATECLAAINAAMREHDAATWRAELADAEARSPAGRMRNIGLPSAWGQVMRDPKLGLKGLRWETGRFVSPAMGALWIGTRLAAESQPLIHATYEWPVAANYVSEPPVVALVEAGGDWHRHESGWTAGVAVIREVLVADTATGLEVETAHPDLVVRYAETEA